MAATVGHAKCSCIPVRRDDVVHILPVVDVGEGGDFASTSVAKMALVSKAATLRTADVLTQRGTLEHVRHPALDALMILAGPDASGQSCRLPLPRLGLMVLLEASDPGFGGLGVEERVHVDHKFGIGAMLGVV